MSSGVAAALLAALCLLLADPFGLARANFFDTFGADARGIALGNAMVADSEGWASVHYNPAALALTKDIEFGLGLFSVTPRLRTDLEQGWEEMQRQFPSRTSTLDPLMGPTMGLVVPLDRLTPKHMPLPVTVGAGICVPRQTLSTTSIIVEDYPVDVIFNERNASTAIHAAISTRITPALYLGVGLISQLETPMEAIRANNLVQAVEMRSRFGPPSLTAGIVIRPYERLRLGLVYRMKNRMKSRHSIVQWTFQFENRTRERVFRDSFISGFTPENIAIGGAYRITERLGLDLEVTYYRWSQYKGPLNRTLANGFDDILVPRVGMSYRVTRKWEARFGFYYEPTPVTNQLVGFFPVGNDRMVPSCGVGYEFDAPWGLLAKPVLLDAYFQYHFLMKQDFERAEPLTRNVRNQNLSAAGYVLNFGLSLTFRF